MTEPPARDPATDPRAATPQRLLALALLDQNGQTIFTNNGLHEVGFSGQFQRRIQIGRQRVCIFQLIAIAFAHRRWFQALLNAVETGCDFAGQVIVRVAVCRPVTLFNAG